jgi:hypothetical protein
MSGFGAIGMGGHLLGAVSLGTAIGEVIKPPAPAQMGCFVVGTMILTAEGEKAVETLSEGDVLVTASGERMPLVWLGRRTIDTVRAPNRLQILPVRIQAGAFAEGVPHRDLFVSADHAMLLAGVLVPAMKLINGGTIAQVEVDEVTYFHVECERHVVLVANGAAAESYLETDNRGFFSNAPGSVDLHPTLTIAERRALLAAPWVNREQIAVIRQANLKRAEAMGYVAQYNNEAAEAAVRPRRIA